MVLPTLRASFHSLLALLLLLFRSPLSPQLDVLALRHQRTVYQRARPKTRLKPADRLPGPDSNSELSPPEPTSPAADQGRLRFQVVGEGHPVDAAWVMAHSPRSLSLLRLLRSSARRCYTGAPA
jgi:hypothetical protein